MLDFVSLPLPASKAVTRVPASALPRPAPLEGGLSLSDTLADVVEPILEGEVLAPGALAFDASGRLWVVETQGAVRVAARGADGWEVLPSPSFAVGRGAPISARFVGAGSGASGDERGGVASPLSATGTTLVITDALRGVLALDTRTGAVSAVAVARRGPADDGVGLEEVPFHHVSASYVHDGSFPASSPTPGGNPEGSSPLSASSSYLAVADLGPTPPSARDGAAFSESDSLMLAALQGGTHGSVSLVSADDLLARAKGDGAKGGDAGRPGGDGARLSPVADAAALGLRAPSSVFVVDLPLRGADAGALTGSPSPSSSPPASVPYLYVASATSSALLRAPLASLAAAAADASLSDRSRANASSLLYELVSPLPGVAGQAVRDPATGEHWVALRAPRSLLERAAAAGSLARYALGWLSRVTGTARLDAWGALMRVDANGNPSGIVADKAGRRVWGLRTLALGPEGLLAAAGPSADVVYVGTLQNLRERADGALLGVPEELASEPQAREEQTQGAKEEGGRRDPEAQAQAAPASREEGAGEQTPEQAGRDEL